MNPVVVVGSGIAGIRAAEAIRAHKYLGDILIIGPQIQGAGRLWHANEAQR